MTKKILVCNSCGQSYDLISREKQTCGYRLPGGIYCNGLIEAVLSQVPSPAEVLECSECGREAHNMEFQGRYCNIRLPSGQSCQGVLKRGRSEG